MKNKTRIATMKKYMFVVVLLLLSFTVESQSKTKNVVIITLDGLRWQELFSGAEEKLMDQQTYLKDSKLREKFWRPTADERRKALMPFFWSTVEEKGQLYGNRDHGCKVDVTNKMLFSYPGYNEILTGKADDKNIDSNDKKYNPNITVLEYINQQKGFEGKVAAFASWDVFPFIINDRRSKVPVSTGVQPVTGPDLSEREKMMNNLVTRLPNPLGDIRLDAFTFYYGLEFMKKNKPRVIYFAFDETDDFAHQGEYAAYLNSAHNTDHFISELWKYVQGDNFYKDKTTFVFTVDHGRGTSTETWKHHGKDYPEASQIWIAILGPDSKALGEVKENCQLYQNQLAKTIASFLKLNFPSDSTGSAIPTAMK